MHLIDDNDNDISMDLLERSWEEATNSLDDVLDDLDLQSAATSFEEVISLQQ